MNQKAQTTLEMTLGLIVAIVFLLGATGLFVWFNRCMAERQEQYRKTRVTNSSDPENKGPVIMVAPNVWEPGPIYDPPTLSLFGGEEE